MSRLGGILAIGLLLAGFTANTALAADQQPFRALLWSDGEGGPLNHALEAGLEDFTQASGGRYPVSVEWVAPEKSEAWLAELKAAGTPPDVYMTSAADLKRHVATGEAYALDGELAKDRNWQERFPAPLLSLLSVGGKTYALPITQTVAVVYYNTEIFRKNGLSAPSTYVDLKKVVQVLNRNGITPIAFGNREGWEGALLSQLIETRLGGGQLFEKAQGGTGDWMDPSFLAAGRVLAELVRLKAFPKGFDEMSNDQAVSYFKQGRAGMLVSRDRLFVSLNFSSSAVRNKVALAPFPTFENGDSNAWVGSPDFNLVVSEQSKAKEAALEFLKTYSTSELQGHFAGHAFVPVTGVEIEKNQLVPLLFSLLELQSNMTRFFLFYNEVLPAGAGRAYEETIRSILTGVDPAAAFQRLQGGWMALGD